jgi:hypothetical protein
MHVSPSQDIFGGDPVHEQQPEEDFMFHLAFRPPNLVESRVNLSVTNKFLYALAEEKLELPQM